MLGRQRRLTARRRDGQEFPLSISFSVAEIQGNLYFTAIMRDITEYKAMEDRVLALRTPGRGGQYRGPYRP